MANNLNPSSTPAKSSKLITATTSKVRVILRNRPFLDHELSPKPPNPTPCISLLQNDEFQSTHEVSVLLKDPETSRNECYKLDGYFEEEDNVRIIFDKEVKGLIPGIFNGSNATVFAYGATGSGKTFTMQGTDEQPGLMTLAMSTVLSMCQATGNIAGISYYEVYLDRCYDLLELKAKEISVLDDKEGQIHLRGLSCVPVNSMSEFHEVFARGIQRRKVSHTDLNDVSSRSHAVLVISVASPSDNGLEGGVTGKMNFIDLAGNEDNKRSGNDGIRLQESAKINQSLFALSNVIYALNNNKPWVPYRESKLTRILQDSLGGRSRSLMVASLNPGNYQEAVQTVSLAARSRHISNVVPSAQKQQTPKDRINMEAKLRMWLESKGKIKSSQRMEAFGSPFFCKTPGCGSSMKKQVVQHNSVKDKTACKETPELFDSRFSTHRKLFDSEVISDYGKQDLNIVDEWPMTTKVHGDGSLNPDVANSHRDGSLNPDELNIVDEWPMTTKVHGDGSLNPDVANSHGDGSLIPNELIDEWPMTTKVYGDGSLNPDVTISRANNLTQSPANRPKIMSCQSPVRKALSPINSNIAKMTINEISSRDSVLSALLESTAPKTPFIVTREKVQDFKTPLDKFNACSSNLKSHLVQEYIDFLNSATREELVELKGIGAKRAEYIIELRETSPLKSLSDLEKIGLSSKQVQQVFSKAAKGIFN